MIAESPVKISLFVFIGSENEKAHRMDGSRRLYTRCQNFYMLACLRFSISAEHTRPVPTAQRAVVEGVIENWTGGAISRTQFDFVVD